MDEKKVNRVAIVTGASGGIGSAIAERLAKDGMCVAVTYCGNPAKAEALCEKISTEETPAKAYQLNVADGASCKAFVKQVEADLGKVSVLVNCAGITRDGLLMTMKEEDWDAVLDTNLKGCFQMIQACSKSLIRADHGKIINISSISGLRGTAGQANYAAAKAGLIALTKTVAREFGKRNVCCNAIAPGFIETEMTANLANKDEYLSNIPLQRAGIPEDVAKVVSFLASAESDYITGVTIPVDGGLSMG